MGKNNFDKSNFDDENKLIRIRHDKLEELKKNNKDPFEITKSNIDTLNKNIIDDFASYENKKVCVAGRLMTRRIMGKASFCDLRDASAKIQVYITRDNIGADNYLEFKKMFDIGDFIEIAGDVFKTHKGEISIRAEKIILLAKSLRQPPEKFHGLTDQETRYRQRYLDLLTNEDVKQKFILRSKIIKSIRKFFDERDFLEVETPILQNIAGGANARPFITHHNALDMNMYMRIALELPLKKLIIGGFDKVYELGRVFRNEGLSIKHNPEFTELEVYQAYADCHDMMDLTENLFRFIAEEIFGGYIIKCDNLEIDLARPFDKISMLDAVKKYADIDFDKINLEQAKNLARERNLDCKDYYLKGDVLNLFFEEYAEKNLVMPTFLLDHPVEISPLTKRKKDNKDYTERFELFIMGREFANAYSELNDPVEQRQRFLYQEKLRLCGNEEANLNDEEFEVLMKTPIIVQAKVYYKKIRTELKGK